MYMCIYIYIYIYIFMYMLICVYIYIYIYISGTGAIFATSSPDSTVRIWDALRPAPEIIYGMT